MSTQETQASPPCNVRKRSVANFRATEAQETTAQTEEGLQSVPEQTTTNSSQPLPTQSSNMMDKYNEKKKPGNLWGLLDMGSVVLENKGAVARDHMANERTFLSWIRTSLGLTTVGVGITQLFKLVNESNNTSKGEFLVKAGRPIGAAFIAIAIICVILGTARFFRVQRMLQDGKYPASRFSTSFLVFLVFSICVVTLGTVVYADS